MLTDKEIYQSANTLVQQHGNEAELVAAARADALLDEGDIEGETVWLRIIDAIRVLNAETPASLPDHKQHHKDELNERNCTTSAPWEKWPEKFKN